MPFSNLKICGITSRETARFCAEAGVDALGAVFYEKSPRAVSPRHARQIFDGLPARVARVGVFVDMPPDRIIAMAQEAGLDTVQLHGGEAPDAVTAILRAGLHVVKVVKTAGEKLLETAAAIPATAGILIECGTGALPGGNGAVWKWADAAPLAAVRSFAVAGGLTPENIAEAARISRASALDVSSGVETAPGIKDPHALLDLFSAVRRLGALSETPFWKGKVEKGYESSRH